MKFENSALIIIDMQNDYIHENGIMNKVLGTKKIQSIVPKAKSFVEAMREKKIEIIHIQMTEGVNDIAENIKKIRMNVFGTPDNWSLAEKGTWGYDLILEVKEDEKIFEKNSFDIFSNKDLENYLKGRGIKNLIIFGGYTNVCVDTSVRSAVTRGFDVILVKDLVGVPDKLQEFHDFSLKVLTTHFAVGLNSDEILAEK